MGWAECRRLPATEYRGGLGKTADVWPCSTLATTSLRASDEPRSQFLDDGVPTWTGADWRRWLDLPAAGARLPADAASVCYDVTPPVHDHHHRDIQGGSARAAVFGISDGLVTNISLILGLSGANPPVGVIRLAGLAGLLGGAFSMAAGEYISMRAQTELFQRELEFERQEIHRRPEGEFQELVRIYESRGIPTELANQVARQMMSDPKTALETHAREELGIHPDLRSASPVQAAAPRSSPSVSALCSRCSRSSSGMGRRPSSPRSLTAVAAVAVGAALSIFTGRSWWKSAFRQLAICAAAGAVTYGVGAGIGLSTG